MSTHNFKIGDLVKAKLHNGIFSAKARSIGVFLGTGAVDCFGEVKVVRVHWSEIGITNERPYMLKKIVI